MSYKHAFSLVLLSLFLASGCGLDTRNRDRRVSQERQQLLETLNDPKNRDPQWYRTQSEVEDTKWETLFSNGGNAFLRSPHHRMYWFVFWGYIIVAVTVATVAVFSSVGSQKTGAFFIGAAIGAGVFFLIEGIAFAIHFFSIAFFGMRSGTPGYLTQDFCAFALHLIIIALLVSIGKSMLIFKLLAPSPQQIANSGSPAQTKRLVMALKAGLRVVVMSAVTALGERLGGVLFAVLAAVLAAFASSLIGYDASAPFDSDNQ